jgi:ectoine hydroxylase-related dioxygenase (phytanoyl-CoA dioxygenase family)
VDAPLIDQEMPPIRVDVDAAKADLAEFGLARVAGALSKDEVADALARLIEQAAGEDAHGCGYHDSAPEPDKYYTGGPNQRVWNLINKGKIFRRLAMNSVMHEIMEHVLGRHFLLSSFTANIACRGGAAQPLHADQQYLPVETPFAAVANCLFMLSDFTPHNGATRVVPGTHRIGRWPDGQHGGAADATGPAGTLMIWDGRLWHGTGTNVTAEPRYGLLAYCCRPFIRQQENFSLSIAREVFDVCSPALRSLLGFQVWGSLGMMSGTPHGTIHSLPVEAVTELAPERAR